MNVFHNRSILVVGVMLAVCMVMQSVQAAAPEPVKLTLSDSVALALANNPAVKIAEADKEKALAIVNQARAHNGFNLSYNFVRARTDEPPSWYNNTNTTYPYSYNPQTHGWIDYPAWPTTYDFYLHKLQLTYPLYTGGKIENSIKLAKHGEAAVNFAVDATRQQLTMEVTTAYFQVLQARNLADVASQGVDDLAAHLKNVQNHYDAGTVALSDVLQTEVRLANARNNLIKAQNTYKLARYKLNKIIGISLHNDAIMTEDFNFQLYEPSVDDSVAIALNKRPEMAQAKLRLDMAKDKLKIAQSGNLPTVAMVATESWKDTLPANSKKKDSWLVGVNVQFNVFDNGLTKSEIKEAQNGIVGAQEQLRQAEDKITLEVCQAYLNVQEANSRINNNKVAVKQADTDYTLAQERYENGIGTNLDVMDAELAKTQAKYNYIQALYDYHISRAGLDKAMGTAAQSSPE